MSIQEELVLIDGVTGPAESMVSALDAVSGAADSAASALGSLGDSAASGADAAISSIDSAASAIDGLESSAASAGASAESALDDVSNAAEDAGEALEEAGDSGESALGGIGESAISLNAALEIGEKALKVAAAVGKIAIAFAGAVSEAAIFRQNTAAALDQLTGGRGEAALDGLSEKAKGLGISTESAVEQFTSLREQGLNNLQSGAIIALRADLDAVGVSGDKADEAIKNAVAAIKSGKGADEVISDIASKFGAVGDGANSAAKRSLTWAGAMGNMEGLGGRVFGKIAAVAGPALDSVGAKITSLLDSFEGSGAIEGVGAAISTALEYVPAIIDEIMVAWDALSAAAGPGVAVLSDAFGQLGDALGESEGGMSTAATIGSILGGVFSLIANGIAGGITAVSMFISAVSSMSEMVSSAIDTVTSAFDSISEISLADAGSALIEGFIGGITNMAGAVMAAVTGIADGAVSAIEGALGIASPSKVGMGIGENLGESVSSGTEEAMPAMIEVPEFAPPANDVGDVLGLGSPVSAAPLAAGVTGAMPAINVTIQISGGAAGVNVIDIEASARRGLIQGLREFGMVS